jgi:hypothetical protein
LRGKKAADEIIIIDKKVTVPDPNFFEEGRVVPVPGKAQPSFQQTQRQRRHKHKRDEPENDALTRGRPGGDGPGLWVMTAFLQSENPACGIHPFYAMKK